MNITVNGREREIPEGTTLAGLLELLKVDHRRVVVELNLEIVNRSQWEEHAVAELHQGDKLEIVQLVGGG